MPKPRTRPILCATGRHRPNVTHATENNGVTRTFCRDCQCELVRTQASRGWYRSGIFA